MADWAARDPELALDLLEVLQQVLSQEADDRR
jgi:hypothetical protein